jgi:hypothetical protein
VLPDSRKDEGWTPFFVQRKTVEPARQVNPNDAVEVNPIVRVSRHDRVVVQPVEKREEEETVAISDVDPKVSSVTDNAPVSEVDSSENGISTIPTQNSTHPSSLPPDPEIPVVAEKVPTLPQGLLIPVMNPGSS